MNIPESGVISFATKYEPANGPGGRIAPATFAEDSAKGHPAGPAFTKDGPALRMSDEGAVKILDGTEPSVIIESQGSQTTRSENLLWELRDELNLPGVVLRPGDEKLIAEELGKKIPKELPKEKNYYIDAFMSRLRIHHDQTSSWTLAHRHIDGFIRLASATRDGKSEIWPKRVEPYHQLIEASPHKLRSLLRVAPNAAIYGYWLSSGAPILHKVARSYSHDIVGYGASQVHYGATKSSDLPTASELKFKFSEEGHLQEAKSGKEASKHLLGTVPSFSVATVTAKEILGRGSLSLGHLRSIISKDRSLSADEIEIIFSALAHLALLGHALRENEWDIRSGCTLVPVAQHHRLIAAGKEPEAFELPDLNTLIEDTKAALAAAQKQKLIGTAADRVSIYISKSLLSVAIPAFVKSLTSQEAE